MKQKFTTHDKIALILLIIGAIMRLFNYGGWSLSNDELSAMARLQFSSFSEMIERGVKLNDMHPIGVQTFLWFWTHLFGTNEWIYRLPFVIAGSFSIWILYLIAKRWFNSTVALFTIALFACLQFPILYSQLARPYSFGMFSTLLFVYFWTRLLFPLHDEDTGNWNKRKLYLFFIVAGSASMYIHYFSFLFVGIVAITGLFYIEKSFLKQYILCGVVMMLLYLPNLSVFIYQFSIGGLGGDGGWLGPPDKDALFQYISYGLNNSTLIIGICLVIFFGSILYYRKNVKFSRYHFFSILFFLLPALIAYFYSIFKNPVFQYSILLFSFPFLLLLLFSFIPQLEWKNRQYLQLIVLTSIVYYSTVFEQKYYTTQHFAVFKDLAVKSNSYAQKYGNEKIEKTINVINPFYIDYYLNRYPVKLNFDLYNCSSPTQVAQLYTIAANSTKPFFLHGWSNNYNSPEIFGIIQQFYPYIVERDSFFNSGLMVFSKTPLSGNLYNPAILFEEFNDFESSKWKQDSKTFFNDNTHAGKASFQYAEKVEYGPTFTTSAGEISLKKGVAVEVSLWAFTKEELKEVSIVFSVERNGNSIIWRGGNLLDYIHKNEIWQQGFFGYDINVDVEPTDKVSIYVWNPAGKKFLIDDMRIRIIKY